MKPFGVAIIWAVSSVLLSGGHAAGAEISQGEGANPSVLVRRDFGDSAGSLGQPLKIRRIEVAVDVVGASATTSMEVRFATPPRGQEADFNLDLPNGSVITGYSLDIMGNMVDGVLTAPRQAAKAYEDRVRYGVWPRSPGPAISTPASSQPMASNSASSRCALSPRSGPISPMSCR